MQLRNNKSNDVKWKHIDEISGQNAAKPRGQLWACDPYNKDEEEFVKRLMLDY